jgi:hypothetical protein
MATHINVKQELPKFDGAPNNYVTYLSAAIVFVGANGVNWDVEVNNTSPLFQLAQTPDQVNRHLALGGTMKTGLGTDASSFAPASNSLRDLIRNLELEFNPQDPISRMRYLLLFLYCKAKGAKMTTHVNSCEQIFKVRLKGTVSMMELKMIPIVANLPKTARWETFLDRLLDRPALTYADFSLAVRQQAKKSESEEGPETTQAAMTSSILDFDSGGVGASASPAPVGEDLRALRAQISQQQNTISQLKTSKRVAGSSSSSSFSAAPAVSPSAPDFNSFFSAFSAWQKKEDAGGGGGKNKWKKKGKGGRGDKKTEVTKKKS